MDSIFHYQEDDCEGGLWTEARGGDQQEKLPVPKGFHFQRRLRARAQVPADPEIVESIKASCKNSILRQRAVPWKQSLCS